MVKLWREVGRGKGRRRPRSSGPKSSTTSRPSPALVRDMLASMEMAEELGDVRRDRRRRGSVRRGGAGPAARLLDKQLANLQGVVGAAGQPLQRRLMAQQNRSLGFRSGGRHARCRRGWPASSSIRPAAVLQAWRSDTEFRDTVVTLLLDNSGSMRGRPITVAATCADILARTLERCGVKVEILGFTTRAWKGGQAREKWLAPASRSAGPLNDLRHIIYKSADAPWRRARRNLGLMMREGLLKENIDGEALLWAHNGCWRGPSSARS
jgi:cobaltochelatase CobT